MYKMLNRSKACGTSKFHIQMSTDNNDCDLPLHKINRQNQSTTGKLKTVMILTWYRHF